MWGGIKGDYESQCFDFHAQCQAWRKSGECSKNEAWMAKHCARSCQTCAAPSRLSRSAYLRSSDYLDIADGNRQGTWAVPYAMGLVMYTQKAAAANAKVREGLRPHVDTDRPITGGGGPE